MTSSNSKYCLIPRTSPTPNRLPTKPTATTPSKTPILHSNNYTLTPHNHNPNPTMTAHTDTTTTKSTRRKNLTSHETVFLALAQGVSSATSY